MLTDWFPNNTVNNIDKPAAVIELKWDKKAEGAISQIKNKGYVDALKDYHGDLLLAGVNYDKKQRFMAPINKQHRSSSSRSHYSYR